MRNLNRSISKTIYLNEADVNIEFYSPFSSRNYMVETKAGLGLQEWAEQAGMELGDLGNGGYRATFSKDQNANNFYRVVALDPPPVFFDDFEAGGERLDAWWGRG